MRSVSGSQGARRPIPHTEPDRALAVRLNRNAVCVNGLRLRERERERETEGAAHRRRGEEWEAADLARRRQCRGGGGAQLRGTGVYVGDDKGWREATSAFGWGRWKGTSAGRDRGEEDVVVEDAAFSAWCALRFRGIYRLRRYRPIILYKKKRSLVGP
jgi:hypothetical protein